jgi:hypothetical protein
MNNLEKPVAISPNHGAEEEAVKALMAAGFALKNLGVVGKSYRSEEKIVRFYNIGDRIKFWGSRGAFWGLFFGGVFLASPRTGPVVALGFLAAIVISGAEGAILDGSLPHSTASMRRKAA